MPGCEAAADALNWCEAHRRTIAGRRTGATRRVEGLTDDERERWALALGLRGKAA